MTDAAILSALDSNRLQKKSGIVAADKCLVITRVLLPKITHASNEPIIAFPIPIQVEASPYL